MRVVLFLPNWIGDVVMATPAIRAIRELVGEQAELTGVMRPYVKEVLAGTPWLNQTLITNPKQRGRWKDTWELLWALRQPRVDLIVYFSSSLRGALIGWFASSTRRIGFGRNGRGILLTNAVQEAPRGNAAFYRSTVDQYLELATACGCQITNRQLELATLPADEQAASNILESLGWKPGQPYVVLNNGGAFGPSKSWPEEHFATLGVRLAEERGLPSLLLCGPAERQQAERTQGLAKHPLVRAYTQEVIPLGASKALVRRATGMVTTDSGPRHFAAAFGIPHVVLFGSMPPELSRNYFPHGYPLRLELDCSPCQKPVCPLLHHRCMRELTPELVFGSLEQALAAKRLALNAAPSESPHVIGHTEG